MKHYILRDRKPVAVDLMTWAKWFEDFDNRRVAVTTVELPEHDPVRVSTVFLGIDHSWSLTFGEPILFESMVFGGPMDQEMYRYATWEQAEAGHAMLVDEATIEGRVAAWEVRERLKALGAVSKHAVRLADAAIGKAKEAKT